MDSKHNKKLNSIEMMARVVHGEARGETYEGKVAVAAVILNRMSTPGFPKNTYDVIFQTNAFTAVHDGQYYLTPNSYSYRAVIDALKVGILLMVLFTIIIRSRQQMNGFSLGKQSLE
ncbi:cell wall hydrolase [Peribacillus frigoritolerans]|nr:cell wall hydrolase [Peribacillus frigoritolerans]